MQDMQNKPGGMAQALRAKSPFTAAQELGQPQAQPFTPPAGPSPVPRFGGSASPMESMPSQPSAPQAPEPQAPGRTLPSFFSYQPAPDDLFSAPGQTQGQGNDLIMRAPELQKSTPAAMEFDRKAEAKAAADEIEDRRKAESARRSRAQQARNRRGGGGQTEGGGGGY